MPGVAVDSVVGVGVLVDGLGVAMPGVGVDAPGVVGVPPKSIDVARTRAETLNFPRAISTSPLVA